MPFFIPASSDEFIQSHAPSPEVIDKLAALSVDQPLPSNYEGDRIRLLAQSPYRLYVYWDLADDPFEPLRRAFGAQEASSYSLTLKLLTEGTDAVSLYEASGSRSQWLDVWPDRSYRVELGLYAEGHPFIRLLSSHPVEAPRPRVSREPAPEREWRVPSDEFARVLDDAGYVSDALEVALEAADLSSHDQATRTIAENFAGAPPSLNEEQMDEMRGALTAIAFGMPLDTLRPLLSPSLQEWLSTFDAKDDGLTPERLLELFRSTLGLEMTGAPFAAPPEADMHRAPRVIVGASEVNLPAPPFHLWMPSMTAGAAARTLRKREKG